MLFENQTAKNPWDTWDTRDAWDTWDRWDTRDSKCKSLVFAIFN